MPLFEVEARRYSSAHFFVEAETQEQAQIDAAEISYEVDFDEDDTEYSVFPTDRASAFAKVWVGGEKGDWVRGDKYNAVH